MTITRRGLFRSLLAAASFAVARHYAPAALVEPKQVRRQMTLMEAAMQDDHYRDSAAFRFLNEPNPLFDDIKFIDATP